MTGMFSVSGDLIESLQQWLAFLSCDHFLVPQPLRFH